jgi:hypothetical protein
VQNRHARIKACGGGNEKRGEKCLTMDGQGWVGEPQKSFLHELRELRRIQNAKLHRISDGIDMMAVHPLREFLRVDTAGVFGKKIVDLELITALIRADRLA